jgi:hypothetical protein
MSLGGSGMGALGLALQGCDQEKTVYLVHFEYVIKKCYRLSWKKGIYIGDLNSCM